MSRSFRMPISNATLSHYLQRYIPPLDAEAPRLLKDQRSQITQFLNWLGEREEPANDRYLLDYCEYLRHKKQPATLTERSVRSHLATLRSWLNQTLDNEAFQSEFPVPEDEDGTPSAHGNLLVPRGRANQWDLISRSVRETLSALWSGLRLYERMPPVEQEAEEGFSLSAQQAQRLVDQLDIATLSGLRDAALIANGLVLGVRALELCALDVEDADLVSEEIRRFLHIPDKPFCTMRDIPYDGFEAVGALNQLWLRAARIKTGPLFRGFYRGYSRLRPERLFPQSIDRILAKYPILREDKPYVLNPLELRRFSARLLAQKGCSLESLRQRLGVAQAQTVLNYLGGEMPRPLEKSEHFEFRLETLQGYESAREQWG